MNATQGLLPLIGTATTLLPMVEDEKVQRLREATKAAGYSLSGAAVAIGLSAQASQKWKKGQIGDDTLKAVAALTSHSYLWLRDGLGGKLADGGAVSAQAAVSQTISIPQYDTGGKGGNGGLILKEQPGIIHNWSVTHEWLRVNIPHCSSPANLCIVTGFGDSMPELYNPGDPILLDKGITSCDHDGIYFFRVGNEGFIKLLQRIPGIGIRVISQNKDYENWTLTPEMDFEVFGKVIRAWKGINY